MALVPNSATDTDGDGLKDWYELTYDLDPTNAADATTVQANGLTPTQALSTQHHPTATATRYLAEGSTGAMFQTRIALANPSVLPATALLRYLKGDGSLVTQPVVVPATGRATVDVEARVGHGDGGLRDHDRVGPAAAGGSDDAVDGDGHYGSHAERSVTAPATTWYLAEGATHSGFDLFYLLAEPRRRRRRRSR